MQGIKKVNKALGIFSKIEKGLSEGIAICSEEKENRYAVIQNLTQEVSQLEASQNKASKVLNKLKEIIG